jgi:antitoxin YobK
VELAEFDSYADVLRRRAAAMEAVAGFALIEGRTATAEQIAAVEREMGVALPGKWTAFMIRYGGGVFGFIELFAIDELRAINDQEFPGRDFVAVAAVGTGDHWGFPVSDGRCHDEVWFRFHDAGDDELVAADFLEFVAARGVRP